MFEDRHIGRFELNASEINSHPAAIHVIMCDLIVLHADSDLVSGQIRYTAICSAFDEWGEGESIPIYDVEYDPETETVNWIKQ